MKLAMYHVPPSLRGRAFDLTLPPGASWVRFGNEVLLYAEETQWKGIADHTRKENLRRRKTIATVKKERMHIVVQNGRLFQQEHPKVPVLVDRGRFLLVELDPDRARRLGRKSPTCYGVLPLSKNTLSSMCKSVPRRALRRYLRSRSWLTKYRDQPFKLALPVWFHFRPVFRPAPTMPALPPRREVN